MSDSSDLQGLFECKQEGFMVEDLLSDVLNCQDHPEVLEGSQSWGTCMIDSKKTINYTCSRSKTISVNIKCK